MKILLRLASAATLCLFATAQTKPLPESVLAALDCVQANELRGDLSFLSSDALQGRYTPSPGLEIAAEFIASKFRAAGLEPLGDHEYFQTAQMIERRVPSMASNLILFIADGRTITIPAGDISVAVTSQAAHFGHLPVVFLPAKDEALLKPLDVRGKAIVTVEANLDNLAPDQIRLIRAKARAFDRSVQSSGATLVLTIARNKRTNLQPSRLIPADQTTATRIPALSAQSQDLVAFLSDPNHPTATLSADVPAPADTPVVVKNVIGILRGSDPVLSKTAVLLTAHYDHIGTVETAAGLSMHATGDPQDRIYNGANDDGSGTVSVIEIAHALARLNPRPKRSIIFMTFFGEERGELGSQFYGKHPAFPISQTVADLNLEQMGRTDSTTGRHVNDASVTGFDYSDVTQFLISAGRRTGISVYRDPAASDAYFARSDNEALARQGIPSHTICVAFDYPDYHGLGDEWQEIDYANMAKVDRMVLLALYDLANASQTPQWNSSNPNAAPFRQHVEPKPTL